MSRPTCDRRLVRASRRWAARVESALPPYRTPTTTPGHHPRASSPGLAHVRSRRSSSAMSAETSETDRAPGRPGAAPVSLFRGGAQRTPGSDPARCLGCILGREGRRRGGTSRSRTDFRAPRRLGRRRLPLRPEPGSIGSSQTGLACRERSGPEYIETTLPYRLQGAC